MSKPKIKILYSLEKVVFTVRLRPCIGFHTVYTTFMIEEFENHPSNTCYIYNSVIFW